MKPVVRLDCRLVIPRLRHTGLDNNDAFFSSFNVVQEAHPDPSRPTSGSRGRRLKDVF